MQEKICCFTGHRIIAKKDIPFLMERIETLVLKLIREGTVVFRVGGALGFDTLAAQLLMKLRDEDGINLKIILYCPFPDFISRWTSKQQKEFYTLYPKYDGVVYSEQKGSREAYLMRNRQMVDGAQFCIAYCIKEHSGTAYTIRYAEEQGVQVFWVP